MRIAMKPLAQSQGETSTAIRRQYERHGTESFYRRFGKDYRNPHEPIVREIVEACVRKWELDLGGVLDLACGSGEVTLALEQLGCRDIDGIDPYTHDAYFRRTGRKAEALSFSDIAAGVLAGRRYSVVFCSFALHLVPPSRLPRIAWELARVSDSLVVITPHKRPHIDEAWGWRLADEITLSRVRARLYEAV
jgi:SAM-dependent methyltransferase